MCVWGNVQATGQFSRKQNRLRQVGMARDGKGRGRGRRVYRMVRYETVQYGHNRTEGNNGTVLGTGQATSDGSCLLAT